MVNCENTFVYYCEQYYHTEGSIIQKNLFHYFTLPGTIWVFLELLYWFEKVQ